MRHTYTDHTAQCWLVDHATGERIREATELERETAMFLDPDGDRGLLLTDNGRCRVEDSI